MIRDWERIVLWMLVIALGFLFSFAAGYKVASSRPVEVVRDTVEVVRVDTCVVEKPVAVYYRVVDTMRVPVRVRDTITVHDSVFVDLPREQAFYQDTTYRAWVSGYRPALDSIEVYQNTRIVTITETVTEPRRRWGFGVSAGYGIAVRQGGVELAPYVGVGISYNFVSW